MTEEVAKVILFAGLGVGVVVWLFGVRCLNRMRAASSILRKEGVVPGKSEADALRVFLKCAVDKEYRIVERRDAGATIEMPVYAQWRSPSVGPIVQISVDFQDQYGGTAYVATADFTRMDRKYTRIMSGLVLLLVPAVVVGVGLALWMLAVPHQDPNVRAQAIQVVQISHALWPPFLVYTLHKRLRAPVVSVLDNLAVLLEVND